MKRPAKAFARLRPARHAIRQGYTLVEMLMATLLTLIMMAAVVTLFESVGKAITDSRHVLEMNDRVRAAAGRLQKDLEGLTVSMQPPRRPEGNEGYFEYTEGPVGPVIRPEALYVNADTSAADTTATDNDDMLAGTTHSDVPFVGRYLHPTNGPTTIESNDAEVIWFVRGRTLYRRVLLVAPGVALQASPVGFYANNDISMHLENAVPVANTLGDLTKPENRFAHQPVHNYGANQNTGFPYHPHFATNYAAAPWGLSAAGRPWAKLGMPTLRESSAVNPPNANTWPAGAALPTITLTPNPPLDLWTKPYVHFWQELDPYTATLPAYNGLRGGEDVILSDVIGFDVKAWDPGAPVAALTSPPPPDPQAKVLTSLMPGDPGYLFALANLGQSVNNIRYDAVSYGAYADLNYLCQLGGSLGGNPNYTPAAGAPLPCFHGAGDWRSGMRGTEPFVKPNLNDPFNPNPWSLPADLLNPSLRDSVYDTWSFHYENDGVQQMPGRPADTGTNGFDDNGDGVVDDATEMETSPPYPVPLRGIQIKIRVFEQSSRQVRQRTVEQDFLPK